MFLISFLIGFCCASSRLSPPASDIGSLRWEGRISVQGIAAGKPDYCAARARIMLDVEEIFYGRRSRRGSGRLLVLSKGEKTCLGGDRLLVSGELLPCAAALPSMLSGYADYLSNHGITRAIICNPWEISVVKARVDKIRAMCDSIKEMFFRVLRRRLSPQSSAMLQAMILGEKSDVPVLIRNAMINSGTIHILVVSGFNVGIVAFMLLMLFRLCRIPRQIRLFLLLPGIGIYCLLTGSSEPVVRAAIMAALMAGASFGQRDGDIQNAFALAMGAMLFMNPRLLFDAGFQLSFASVFALIIAYPLLRRTLAIDRLKCSFVRLVADGLLVSLSAWVGTAGLIACYFRMICPGSILINLLAAPLSGFITLCGFSLILADTLLPFLAASIATATDYAVCLLIYIVSLKLPVIRLS